MITSVLLGGGAALAVSAIAQVGLVRWLPRWGLVDVPNVRSSHAVPTPRGGGVGIAAAMAVGVVLVLTTAEIAVAVGTAATVGLLAVVAFIGLADDVRGLAPLLRVGLLGLGGGLLGVAYGLQLWEAAAVALWVTACTNAVNFMDGINGITGMTSVVAGVWYTMTGLVHGEVLTIALGAAAAGASVGFLPFNVPRAKLFLGDCGSYLLGATFAVCSLVLWLGGASPVVVLAPLALYLADTGSTLLRRALRREPLLSAHRDHAYQQLSRERFTHLQVSVAVAALAAACCAAALVLPTAWAALVLIVLSAIYLGSPAAFLASSAATAGASS